MSKHNRVRLKRSHSEVASYEERSEPSTSISKVSLAQKNVPDATSSTCSSTEEWQHAINKVYTVLVDYMKPEKVIDSLFTSKLTLYRLGRDMQELTSTSEKNRTLIKKIMERKMYQDFKNCLRESGQENIAELLEMAERGEETSAQKKKIADNAHQEMSSNQLQQRIQDMKKDLIEFYKGKHNTIPVSPLAEEYDVLLDDFYVPPTMKAIDLNQLFGNHQGSAVKRPISSYKDLFFLNDGTAYKHIYVTAKAGIGKTSFSKRLCMAWCKGHDSDKPDSGNICKEDEDAMKYYDFLFLLSLRDVPKSACDVEELVRNLIKNSLTRRTHAELVEEILNTKSCLIVMDGLDEWVHPTKCPNSKEGRNIPHARCWKKCTILTTSRPWKFDTIKLPSHEIDQHIEIHELDRPSTKKLIANAIRLLNKRLTSSKPAKSVKEFEKAISTLNLGDIMHVPYIILQIVCVWFDTGIIGNTKCEIYTNVIDLTLKRGSLKLGQQYFQKKKRLKLELPEYLRKSIACREHAALLLSLGELSFYFLFNREKESALVFDKHVALKYLGSEKKLAFCLKIGLLSQSKGYEFVSFSQSNVSFLHKTMQEYFSALYLLLNIEIESLMSAVTKVCSSLKTFLDMSNVFIFLSGFHPQLYSSLSNKLYESLSGDEIVSKYRAKLEWFLIKKPEYECMHDLQTLHVECVRESRKQGSDAPSLPLEDIIINNRSKDTGYISFLKTVIGKNLENMKSVSFREIESSEEFTEISQFVNLLEIGNLEKLELYAVASQEDLERVLKNSVNTMKCLSLRAENCQRNRYFCKEKSAFSKSCVDSVLNMTNLQAILLESFAFSHDQLDQVTSFISNRVSMNDIVMRKIECTCANSGFTCSRFLLDLSKHRCLKTLHLDNVPLSHLDVNTEQLEECEIGCLPAGVASSWLHLLPNTPSLHKLVFGAVAEEDRHTLQEIISQLFSLGNLYFRNIELAGNEFPLAPDMNRLDWIQLVDSTISSSALRGLTESVSRFSQPVTVMLRDCNVTPEEAYTTLKTDLKLSKRFRVLYDGIDHFHRKDFRFQTVP